jgi:hypothetical protein
MMQRSRAILGVVLIFVLGLVCGLLAANLLYNYRIESIITGRAESREEAIVKRLDRKLDLDDRQEEQVRAIVHETQEGIKTLRTTLRPQTEAIIEKAQARIRSILTPEQRTIYEKMIAERKERIRKKGFQH